MNVHQKEALLICWVLLYLQYSHHYFHIRRKGLVFHLKIWNIGKKVVNSCFNSTTVLAKILCIMKTMLRLLKSKVN